jgi:polyisoprenoid-binding protein YceI
MMLRSLAALLIIPAAVGIAAPAAEVVELPPVRVEAPAPATYQIDPVHSELTFRVRHLIGRVAGTFNEWSGTLQLDPNDLQGGKVDVTVQTASINTLNGDRDAHLRTPDFFAVDSFPTMTFRSNRVEVNGDRLKVHGDLTLRGITKPVVLDGRYLGRLEKDPWGAERVAFLATTTINRQDFGVSFNQALETMTMIGDQVEIEIAIEAVKQ